MFTVRLISLRKSQAILAKINIGIKLYQLSYCLNVAGWHCLETWIMKEGNPLTTYGLVSGELFKILKRNLDF